MDLNRDAMLVGLHIATWSGRIYDREASNHVAVAHDASASAGRYNKRLLPKAAFAALTATMSETRTKHYENSLPWDDKGARLLTVANYEHYTELMGCLRERVVRQRARFIEDYDDYVDQARLDLGKLFRIEDYPSPPRSLLPLPLPSSCPLSLYRPHQARTEPRRELVVAGLAPGDAGDGVGDHLIILDKLVAASLHQQLDQVERGSLVTVGKPVVRHDPVYHSRGLLVDAPVVPVVGPGKGRADPVLVYDSRRAAVQECLLVAPNRIRPGDAVVPPTDWPAPSSRSGASPTSP